MAPGAVRGGLPFSGFVPVRLYQVEVSSRVFYNQRVRVGLVLLALEGSIVEKTEVRAAARLFRHRRGQPDAISRHDVASGIPRTRVTHVRQMSGHTQVGAKLIR